VLTVLSIIQALAFNYLAEQFPGIFRYSMTRGNYIVFMHFILCFVILVRIYQTFMGAVLDYNFILPRLYEMFLISTVGITEYFLFESLKPEGKIESFNQLTFHTRGIIISGLGTIGYFIILLQFMRRNKLGMHYAIPFEITPPQLIVRRNKPRKRSVIPFTITPPRFEYKPDETNSREVWLQEVNIISLLVIIGIESQILRFGPLGDRELGVLVGVIIIILCLNIYYSVHVTFGRRAKSSKQQPNSTPR
jgi:hypothetical protein